LLVRTHGGAVKAENIIGLFDFNNKASNHFEQKLENCKLAARGSTSSRDTFNLNHEILVWHKIKTDKLGNIAPWYSDNVGYSFDFAIDRVFDFWYTMRTDLNGLPYYMNHMIWAENYTNERGLGGDQLNMALSSWRLYYGYTGDKRVFENMKFIADYYLTHSLSLPTDEWSNIPYPYNTLIYSGVYDGDMILGKGFTQPDKAGAFGFELLQMYKMTENSLYLDAAVNIANTLAKHTKTGNNEYSPLPFKVNART